MIIGVPKEVKDHESRVGVTPAGVHALAEAGHKVLVETNAGALSAFTDDEYQAAGAEIVGSAYDTWRLADMVVKVKEPTEKEYKHFREGLVLFTYLHLAPLNALTDALLEKKVTGIAYEDRARPRRHAAAAYPDVRSGGPHVRAGGCDVSRERARWPRCSAGRCPRHSPRTRVHRGRRHRGHQRGQDCARHGCPGDAGRPEPEPPARAGRHLWRPRPYAGLKPL